LLQAFWIWALVCAKVSPARHQRPLILSLSKDARKREPSRTWTIRSRASFDKLRMSETCFGIQAFTGSP